MYLLMVLIFINLLLSLPPIKDSILNSGHRLKEIANKLDLTVLLRRNSDEGSKENLRPI